jgi:hypothetical protein
VSLRLASLLALTGAAVFAAPSLDVRPLAGPPPRIDGVLDDDAWQTAARSDAFRQVAPVADAAPSERTELLITYDALHLYVAVRCQDSDPAGIRARQMRRDADDNADDLVRLVLDPFGRRSDGYFFTLTAAGAKHDGRIEAKERAKSEWDGVWHGRVARDATGWSAEWAIPTTTLAFDPASPAWGFEVERIVRRKQESLRWAGRSRVRPATALADAGELRGLTGLRQGRGLEFKPFARLTHTARDAAGRPAASTRADAGFDLTWQATPSLAATLTVNTDFAETDVDEREVNLTRFSLFFPEKRDVFLRDAPLFGFGNITYNPRPYFSRRIGLAPDGTPLDLLAGVKLAGRAGPWTLGLLDVQVDESPRFGLPSKNLFVGRIARDVLAESSAGLLFTHGEPRAAGQNTLVGADFNYVTHRLAGGRALEVHSWLTATDSDLAGGQAAAGAVQIKYPNEPLDLYGYIARYGRRYDPGLGFAPRVGIAEYILFSDYSWRSRAAWWRRASAKANFYIITDLAGRIENETITLPGTTLQTQAGDEAALSWRHFRERLVAPFAIRPGVTIPRGDYRWQTVEGKLTTTPARPLAAAVEFRTGGFYAGTRTDTKLALEWRASRYLFIRPAYELRAIRLPQGDFDVRLASLRANVLFTPDLALTTLAQYDNVSRSLGVNVRLRWEVQPGNTLFLVFNQGYDADSRHLVPRASEAAAKAAWTFRF